MPFLAKTGNFNTAQRGKRRFPVTNGLVIKLDAYDSLSYPGTGTTVYNIINDYVNKYNSFPTLEAVAIDLSNKEGLNESVFKGATEVLASLEVDKSTKLDWLLDNTEKWCQDRALHLAILKSIQIMDDKSKGSISKGAIPQILSDALAISFDSNIGTDILEDSDKMFNYIHNKPSRLPLGFEMFDKITKGGLLPKTLNVVIAGVGVGKTFALTNFAVQHMLLGKNVLYFTLEVSEEEIATRIYANLLDVPIEELEDLPRDMYDKKIQKAKSKTAGKLKIIEYPTSGASVSNFRYSVNELQLKKGFIPDVIYVDYLNICASAKLKYNGSNVNSYSYIKSIAEELRAFGIEKNVPIFSATQLTRSGSTNSDPGLEDTSESFGLPATADFQFALTNSEELESLDQLLVKQLKNRYRSISPENRRFVIGVDRKKMRFYDVEDPKEGVMNDTPVMDKTTFGEQDKERSKPSFSGFK